MDNHIFETIDSDQKAYWLGFLAADGIINHKTRLTIGLAERDIQQLENFKNFLQDSNQNIVTREVLCSNNGKRYPSCYYEIYNKALVADLEKYGIIQDKSHLDIDFLQFIPEKYKINFIFGLFDGDGWFVDAKSYGFGICGNYSSINSIREYLVNYFQWDILSLKQYTKNKTTFYFQSQSCYKINDFISKYLLYSYHMPRKVEIAKNLLKRTQDKILQIEEAKITKIPARQTTCPICGIIFDKKRNEQKYCSLECLHKSQQRVEKPNREALKLLIRNSSFVQIGKQFGVTDNAVRKWCQSMELPKTKKEIKSYSDEEWQNV